MQVKSSVQRGIKTKIQDNSRGFAAKGHSARSGAVSLVRLKQNRNLQGSVKVLRHHEAPSGRSHPDTQRTKPFPLHWGRSSTRASNLWLGKQFLRKFLLSRFILRPESLQFIFSRL